MVQYSTVQYSTGQDSTVQYSTVQYSTVQYSTVQYSTGSTHHQTRWGLASLQAAVIAMLQVGGLPDWPDTLAADTAAPRCAECGQEQVLVTQVAAPLAHLPPACARTLYLFCCLQPACWTRPAR